MTKNLQTTPTICALATVSHMHLAITMADSFIRHHSDGKVYILQVDGEKMSFPTREDFLTILHLSELGIENDADSMKKRYNIFEFCNALKPYLLKHLLKTTNYKAICYIDSDIYFLGNMQEQVWDKFDECSVMLTPHFVKVSESNEEIFQRELGTIVTGIYNAGFVGVKNDENGLQFTDWWKGKTFRGCYKRPEEGLYVDQRWLDLVPGYDLGVKINRNPGLNVAFWNLRERKIIHSDGKFLANGEPISFFHISGFSPDKPDVLSKIDLTIKITDYPHLPEIFNEYAKRLIEVRGELNQQEIKQVLSENQVATRTLGSSSQTTVSVIIFAEKGEKFSTKAIESVLEQIYVETEIIVINKGLNDDELETLKDYGDKIVLIDEPSETHTEALNSALEKAKGDFIIFLKFSDQLLFPTALEEQVSAFKEKDCAVVLSGWRRTTHENSSKKSGEHLIWLEAPKLNIKHWFRIFFTQMGTMMFRRSNLIEMQGFDKKYPSIEFSEITLRLFKGGFSAKWLKRTTVACIDDIESSSNSLVLQSESLENLLDDSFENQNSVLKTKLSEDKARFESLVLMANRFFLAGNLEEMKKSLTKSLKYTNLSARGALMEWFSKFSRTARFERRDFDAFALTNSPQWQQLEQLEFGDVKVFDEKENLDRQEKLNLDGEVLQTSQINKAISINDIKEKLEIESSAKYQAKLNLKHTFSRFVGKHRSGWNFALQNLLPLHTDSGIYFDGACDTTFDTGRQNLQTDLKKGWIGVFHNPPEMPEWFAPTRTQKAILQSKEFQDSLKNCYGIFCLSQVHCDWLAEKVDVPVSVLLHPTETPEVKFSMEKFLANPEKRLVQIGHWIRKLHSIYFVPTFIKRTIIHQDFDYVRKMFDVEKKMYDLNINRNEVEKLPFLSEADYDELLAENLAYIELYDATANNAVIECIVRNTPILVNPLPSIKEYLGEDYPLYFTNKMEAADKAENFDLIAETHEYLKNLPIKKNLTAEHFLKSFAESEIYQNLPA